MSFFTYFLTYGGMNTYNVKIGEAFLNGQILHVCCKSFIQPEIIPPAHGDQVPEPLKQGKQTRNINIAVLFRKRQSNGVTCGGRN